MKSYPIPTYGIDTSLYSQKERTVSKNVFKLPNEKTLLYTGRFSPDKNIGALLATYAALRVRIPGLQLVLAISFKDQAYFDALSNQLRDVTVLERVEASKLATLYSAADLFVSCGTSYFETFGRSPLESIACGTPVVVPDWDGFRNYVTEEVGRLVPVDFLDILLYEQASYAMVDLDEFVTTCEEVLTNPPLGPFNVSEDLTFAYTSVNVKNLLQELAGKGNIAYEGGAALTRNAVINRIVTELKIASAEHLFNLTTCAIEDLPTLDSSLMTELYGELFDRNVFVSERLSPT